MKKKITFSKSGVGNIQKSKDDILSQALERLFGCTGATRNRENNYYSLNGISNISEEEMTAIYNKKEAINNLDLHEVLRGCNIRTIVPCKSHPGTRFKQRPLKGYYSFAYSSLEVLKFSNEQTLDSCESEELLPAESLDSTFLNCDKLRIIYPINVADVNNIGDKTFDNCTALQEVRLHGLNSPLNLSSSPLLSYKSLLYLIENKKSDTKTGVAITPTTYKYLATLQEPEESVGGTREEWAALLQKATEKKISFSTPGTVAYITEEVINISKGDINDKRLTIEDVYCNIDKETLCFP